MTTCPYCLFSYKVYGRYENMAEDTMYVLMKSNQTNLLNIGSLNTTKNKKPKKQRQKEFWSAVNASYLVQVHTVFILSLSTSIRYFLGI